MTQSIINKNLCTFLNMTEGRTTTNESIVNGACFGLSVIHGAMDAVGKLDWWEAALIKIVEWDGTEKSLNELVELPNADEDARWSTSTLKTLFYRVYSYVCFHQDPSILNIFDANHSEQKDVLSPKSNIIEIIDTNGIVKKIARRSILAGYFAKTDLVNFLDENLIQHTICLVHSNKHTIRIGFKDGQWFVYDPNYSHDTINKIRKFYSNKSDLVDEVISILSQTIVLDIATFDQAKNISLPKLVELEQFKVARAMRYRGLHMIARYTPDELLNAVKKAACSPDVAERIAIELETADWDDYTGLHKIACYSAKDLKKILEIVAHTLKGVERLANALVLRSKYGWTGLGMVVCYAPTELLSVLNLLCFKNPKAKNAVMYIADELQKCQNNFMNFKNVICERNSSNQLYFSKFNLLTELACLVIKHDLNFAPELLAEWYDKNKKTLEKRGSRLSRMGIFVDPPQTKSQEVVANVCEIFGFMDITKPQRQQPKDLVAYGRGAKRKR